MKVAVEQSACTIGVDNAIADAVQTGNWGVLLTFSGDELNNRYQAALSLDEARSLAAKLIKNVDELELLKLSLQDKILSINETVGDPCIKMHSASTLSQESE